MSNRLTEAASMLERAEKQVKVWNDIVALASQEVRDANARKRAHREGPGHSVALYFEHLELERAVSETRTTLGEAFADLSNAILWAAAARRWVDSEQRSITAMHRAHHRQDVFVGAEQARDKGA